jgi:deoxyribose-phosphate aldolase
MHLPIQQHIEHTLLSPVLGYGDIDQLVAEARQHLFKGVCVPPYWVEKTKRDLRDLPLSVVTVIGFPLGYQRSATKRQEMETAIKDGADELDLVMCLSAFKSRAYDWVKIELAQMAKLAHEHEKILKVIIETAYLDTDEIRKACELCTQTGVDYVKTSTGFAPKGAQVEDIALMRQCLPESVGIKASGGIKTLAQAQAMLQAGADLIGTSQGVAIVKEALG